ncbi:MAG: hypothetical protein R3C11_24220 [Planctomycetaceae bacterium]
MIGHYQGNFNNRLAQIDWDDFGKSIDPDTAYLLHLHFDGSRVDLSVDGSLVTSATFVNPFSSSKLGLASYNAVTSFDNVTIGMKAPLAPPAIPYAEDFEDNTADQFAFVGSNRWTTYNINGSQKLLFNGANLYGLGVAYLDTDTPLPSQYEIVSRGTSYQGSNVWNNGFLIFDYQSPNDFKYAGMFTGTNEWVIGHFQGNWNNRIAVTDMSSLGTTINSIQEYTLLARIDGAHVDLLVDGIKIVSGTFATGIHQGTAGVAGYNSLTSFDDIEISSSVSYGKPYGLPYMEDFNDTVADQFEYNRPLYWKVVGAGADKVLRTNNTFNQKLATAYVPLDPAQTPPNFLIEADIRSLNAATGLKNGFIIFDYKNDNDFKYAGFFTGQNEWIIGHYQGDWNNRLATVDWDNNGRTINLNQWYSLAVTINGSTASLSVNGEFITSADFGTALNQGSVGIAADSAFTWFDNFSLTTPSPSLPLASDPIYANWEQESDQLLI